MRKTFILPVLALLAVLITVSIASAVPICATVNTTYVSGIIADDTNNETPISGASVSVDCNGHIQATTSAADGSYSVQYPASQCTNGDSVSVSATYDSLSGSSDDVTWTTENHQISCLQLIVNVACVNVSLIPEFGLIIGALTLVSAVGIFVVVRRK